MKKIENSTISIVESATDARLSTITVEDYFRGIIDGKWQDEVIEYRTGRRKKPDFHAVMASGLFTGRKDSDLKEHSGLLVIDIDGKDQERPIQEIKESLLEIPEIYAIHTSLSGEGLAVYFRIKKDKHFESFEAITRMLTNDYDVVCDMHCSNIGRLRFVSYDPDCHLNFGAITWNYFVQKEKRIDERTYSNVIFSNNDIDFILRQIRDRQVNIAPDYYSWLRIGFALSSQLGASGKEAFMLISSFYHGKQTISPEKQYERCLRAKKSGVTIKSFFYFAKQAGCDLSCDRTKKIVSIGVIRRKQESSDGGSTSGRMDAKKYLDEFEGISGKDVDDILDQIWQQPVKDIQGDESLLTDIETYLRSNYTFRLNEITNIVEVNGEPMNDYLFNTIQLKTKKILDKANKDTIFDIIHSDFTPKYNPILDWFEKNKHVRTTGNIKKLAECIDSNLSKKDADFVHYFLEKWLLSIVASSHRIYSILCLVLTGDIQGTGKTNFFRELLPEPISYLFAINKLDGKEADIGQLMCSKLIILDDEFGGKSKQDEKKFKELISKDKFSIRKPYGRYFEDMQRLAVLCGTTNEEQVINDLTGNRRIIPIQTNYIDEKKYNEIDKTELFIELYWKFREDPKSFFLTREDITRLNDVCFDATQSVPEFELPLKYFKISDEFDIRASFLSTSEIRSVIEQRSGIRISQQKLSISLKKLGYNYDRRRSGSNQTRGFYVIDKQAYNIPNNELPPLTF